MQNAGCFSLEGIGFFLIFLFTLRVLLSSTRLSSFRKDWTEARSMLVQYSSSLTWQPDPEKAWLFPLKSRRNRKKKMFVDHDIFVVSRIRFVLGSLCDSNENFEHAYSIWVFNSISGSGAFDFPSPNLRGKKNVDVRNSYFSSLFWSRLFDPLHSFGKSRKSLGTAFASLI